MPKVSRTYRIEQETADRIADISESEGKTATEVVEAAIRAYSSEEYAGNTAKQADSTDFPALAALIDQLAVKDAQLAKKDEQIAKLMETVADMPKLKLPRPTPEIADDADVKQAISSAWQRCDAWRLSHAKDAPKPKPRPGGGSASQQQTQRRKEQPSHEWNPNIGQGR